jgi:hypothetical protein
MEESIGIVVYEIIDNGRILNGIFTNNNYQNDPRQFDITNEIAVKNIDGIAGNYSGTYTIEHDNTKATHRLEISRSVENTNSVYIFIWRDNSDNVICRGIGLNAGNNHIAVSYWETTS